MIPGNFLRDNSFMKPNGSFVNPKGGEMNDNLKTLKALPTDEAKWAWLLKEKPQDIIILLDGDYTMAAEDDMDVPTVRFDTWLGWSRGVQVLLNVAGIRNECV